MNDQKLDHQFFEQVKSEHAELIELMKLLRAEFNSDIRDPGTVNRLVGNLYEHIVAHFAHEERGGYLCEALERAPRLTEQAKQLLAQHETLNELLGELRNVAQRREDSELWWQALRDTFNQFSRELLRHEAAEDKLLQDAFNQDMGTAD